MVILIRNSLLHLRFIVFNSEQSSKEYPKAPVSFRKKGGSPVNFG